MVRNVEDLKALVMAGDGYTEVANIKYMGHIFAVPIRPLTEEELTDIERKIKISGTMLKAMKDEVKPYLDKGIEIDKLNESEKATIIEGAVNKVADSGNFDPGEITYIEYLTNRAYCRAGILDEGLRQEVSKFRFGLTGLIAARIKLISEVPPSVMTNFFGQEQASSSP